MTASVWLHCIRRYYFYIHPPKSGFNWLAFFAPFSLGIWICFLATILILPLLILLLNKWNNNNNGELLNKESTIENVGKIFFEMFSLIVQQGKIIIKTRDTVSSELEERLLIILTKFFTQYLLSKNYVLLRLLFEGGY